MRHVHSTQLPKVWPAVTVGVVVTLSMEIPHAVRRGVRGSRLGTVVLRRGVVILATWPLFTLVLALPGYYYYRGVLDVFHVHYET
jgi:hypothetical protein